MGETEWAADQLSARLARIEAQLAQIALLTDAETINTSRQVQHSLLRYCANTVPGYWLRTMPPAAAKRAAREHDDRIAEVAAEVFDFDPSTAVGGRAARQLRLPTSMGGMGLTSCADIAPAAFVGSLSAFLAPIVRLCPRLAEPCEQPGDSALPTIATVAAELATISHLRAQLETTWRQWDAAAISHDCNGDALFRWHPEELPTALELPCLALLTTHRKKPDETYDHAQRALSRVLHHQRWLALFKELGSDREYVRFISASQPLAGACFNAVPSRADFRIDSAELLVMAQRRLGLPLSCMRGIEYSQQLGREVDQLGDVFLTFHNHSKRHNGVVGVLARAARQALNAKVQTEDMQHEVYSPGARPDVRIRLRTRKFKLLEVKVLCPISSNPGLTGHAGTYAAFANTAPAKREEVAAKYAPAKINGHDVTPCVFEVFGSAAPEVMQLLEDWGRAARSKTPPGEEPPWSARNFIPYWSQLLSKEAQRGAAIEILNRVDGEAADREAARLRSAGS